MPEGSPVLAVGTVQPGPRRAEGPPGGGGGGADFTLRLGGVLGFRRSHKPGEDIAVWSDELKPSQGGAVLRYNFPKHS